MRNIDIPLDNIESTILRIGRVGENLHVCFRFNCSRIFADYPAANVSMVVRSPHGDIYPAAVQKSGNYVLWTVVDGDLGYQGNGNLQITFTNGDEIIKTAIGTTSVLPSLVASGEMPDPVQNWIDEAEEVLQRLEDMSIDDTAGAGVTNRVWSADKLTREFENTLRPDDVATTTETQAVITEYGGY